MVYLTNVILNILWIACHNPKIDQKTGKVKMTRCLEECKKQQRTVQEELEWKKQQKEEVKKEQKRRGRVTKE